MDLPSGEKLPLFVDQAAFAKSVHGDMLRCTACHTDKADGSHGASTAHTFSAASDYNRTSETGVLETEQILADVILNMKLPESRRLAEEVQRQMLDRVVEGFGPVRDLGSVTLAPAVLERT